MRVSLHHPPVALLHCKLAPINYVALRSTDPCLLHKHANSSPVNCKSMKAEMQTAGDVENVVPPTETKRLRVYYIRQEGDTKVPKPCAVLGTALCRLASLLHIVDQYA